MKILLQYKSTFFFGTRDGKDAKFPIRKSVADGSITNKIIPPHSQKTFTLIDDGKIQLLSGVYFYYITDRNSDLKKGFRDQAS